MTQVEILDSLVPNDAMQSPEQNLKDLEDIYQKGLSNQNEVEEEYEEHDSIFDKVKSIKHAHEEIMSERNYGNKLAAEEVADNLT